jgi:hypothetical protein
MADPRLWCKTFLLDVAEESKLVRGQQPTKNKFAVNSMSCTRRKTEYVGWVPINDEQWAQSSAKICNSEVACDL